MPLIFNLRHLEKKVLHAQGECPAGDFDVGGVDELIQMVQPLRYDLWIEKLKQSVLVRGPIRFILECQCARCLRPFQKEIEILDWSLDLALEGEGKVAVDHERVDLTPFIREDILLAFPQHPLCQTECSGLPLAMPDYQNASETQASGASSAWDELNKLQL